MMWLFLWVVIFKAKKKLGVPNRIMADNVIGTGDFKDGRLWSQKLWKWLTVRSLCSLAFM
jgi:hypothetical protein